MKHYLVIAYDYGDTHILLMTDNFAGAVKAAAVDKSMGKDLEYWVYEIELDKTYTDRCVPAVLHTVGDEVHGGNFCFHEPKCENTIGT
jgi:hypothetical protein